MNCTIVLKDVRFKGLSNGLVKWTHSGITLQIVGCTYKTKFKMSIWGCTKKNFSSGLYKEESGKHLLFS